MTDIMPIGTVTAMALSLVKLFEWFFQGSYVHGGIAAACNTDRDRNFKGEGQ